MSGRLAAAAILGRQPALAANAASAAALPVPAA
jgi:hypothetical protein